MTETKTRNTASCDNLNPFVCEYQPADREICVDQDSNCARDLSVRPSACEDFPHYAKTRCPKSCGLCTDTDPKAASTDKCSDPASQGGFSLVAGGATIHVGGVYKYECNSGYVLAAGDLVRRCTTAQTLTGAPPSCLPRGQVDTLTNDIEIRKRLNIAASGYVYTGDNKNHRIPTVGRLKRWDFYSTNQGTMELQVWREAADKTFTLVGTNAVPVARDWRRQTLHVAPNDQITVQENDVIAFLFTGFSEGGVSYDRCTDALSPEATSTYKSSIKYAVGDLVVGNNYTFSDVPGVLYSGANNRCRIYSIVATVGP